MSPEFDADLVRYLATRDRQRDAHVNRVLDSLSDRERRLVREAAVMGYVRGQMAGRVAPEEGIPKDSAIVWNVVACCQGFPDLYPILSTPKADSHG